MPEITIRVTNASFISSSDDDYVDAETAYRAAVAAGVDIVAQEVRNGKHSAIVKLEVLQDSVCVMLGAVSVAQARLTLEDANAVKVTSVRL